MTDKKQNGQATPPPDADAATPFFARFLEDQHGGGVEAANQTLKYPSDRDEWDFDFTVLAEAATTRPGPSGRSLKYPSDRDEDGIDFHVLADAETNRPEPSHMTLKYPSDRDEIDNVHYH